VRFTLATSDKGKPRPRSPKLSLAKSQQGPLARGRREKNKRKKRKKLKKCFKKFVRILKS